MRSVVRRLASISRFAAGAVTIWLAIAGPAPAGDTQPHLRLFASSQTPPKSYLDQDRPAGYMIEVSVEALRRAGYRPEIEAVPWTRAVAAAEAGEGVITAFSRTAERERIFQFSDVVYEDRVVLVTRRDADFPFESLKDLANRSIGMQRASSYGPELEAVLGTFNAVRDSGHCERLKMLAAGRIDGAIMSGGSAAVLFNARTVGIDSKDLVIHPTPIAIDPNYMAVARSRPDAADILRRIDLALADMARDGTTRRIIGGYDEGF